MLGGLKNVMVSILLITTTIVTSQNIVPNNSFETYYSLPNGYGQWSKAVGWSNLNLYPFFAWPYASPDYLHMTGSGGADLPVSTFGTVTPATGDAVMGFITWMSTPINYREYLSINFTTPMEIGVPYTISFQITNGSAGWYCGYSSNHIGVQFSTVALTQLTNEPVGGTPQLEIVGELWNTNWQLITFTYTPDSAYNYITIGNFYNDASTAHSFHVASLSASSYYFIDDIIVQPELPLPITLNNFDAIAMDNHVQLNWQTVNEIQSDYFTVERSTNGEEFTELNQVNAAGNSNEINNYGYIDEYPEIGINYYRIKTTNVNYNNQYSPIKSVEFNTDSPIVSINPIPCSNSLNVATSSANVGTLVVHDLSGKMVLTAASVSGNYQLQTDQLSPGIYLLTYTNPNRSSTLRFIKQ